MDPCKETVARSRVYAVDNAAGGCRSVLSPGIWEITCIRKRAESIVDGWLEGRKDLWLRKLPWAVRGGVECVAECLLPDAILSPTLTR